MSSLLQSWTVILSLFVASTSFEFFFAESRILISGASDRFCAAIKYDKKILFHGENCK